MQSDVDLGDFSGDSTALVYRAMGDAMDGRGPGRKTVVVRSLSETNHH